MYSQTHQPVVLRIIAGYLLLKEREPFKDHLSTHGCLTSLRNKPQQSLGKLHYKYLPKLLVNVYSCCLMEKSVSCCYGVEGKSDHIYRVSLFYGMEWNILQHYFPERNNCSTLIYMQILLVWDCGVIYAATELRIYSLHYILQ